MFDFFQFLPKELTSNLKSGDVSPAVNIWKLKPNTEKIKPVKVYTPGKWAFCYSIIFFKGKLAHTLMKIVCFEIN